MSVKQRMDKQTVGHLFTGIAVSNKSEQTTYTCSNFDKSQNNMLREIKQTPKAIYGLTLFM